MEVNKPNRDADVILPREGGVSKVWIWFEENVFAIVEVNNCHNHIESNGTHYKTALSYLEYCSDRTDTPIRARISSTYVFEYVINSNRNDITT